MSDLYAYLEEREKYLETEVAKLRALIAPLERELFEVRVARRAVTKKSPEPQQRQLFQHRPLHVDEAVAEIWKQYLELKAAKDSSPYAGLTIKQLVTKALDEQFPSGATASQLLELFSSGWGRSDIVRTSLSPQLSRLRKEGRVDRRGTVWFLRRPQLQHKNAAADQ